MYCTSCGEALTPEMKFCKVCGAATKISSEPKLVLDSRPQNENIPASFLDRLKSTLFGLLGIAPLLVMGVVLGFYGVRHPNLPIIDAGPPVVTDLYLVALGVSTFTVTWTILSLMMCGQTPAMQKCKLKLVRISDGNLPKGIVAFLRIVLVPVFSYFTFGLNILWPLWDKKKQSILDKIFRTSVIKAESSNSPARKPRNLITIPIALMVALLAVGGEASVAWSKRSAMIQTYNVTSKFTPVQIPNVNAQYVSGVYRVSSDMMSSTGKGFQTIQENCLSTSAIDNSSWKHGSYDGVPRNLWSKLVAESGYTGPNGPIVIYAVTSPCDPNWYWIYIYRKGSMAPSQAQALVGHLSGSQLEIGVASQETIPTPILNSFITPLG
jgi:uncharacterized RDD family membrane protein YckC